MYSFGKGLLVRSVEFISCPAYRKDTYNIIFLRHVEDCGDLIADPVVIRDMAFVPAALISQLDDGKQNVLDGWNSPEQQSICPCMR